MLEWDILNYLKKWRTNLRATENVDHDYQNYFNAIYDNTTISEPTFLFFSLVIRNFSLPPGFLFLLYATL